MLEFALDKIQALFDEGKITEEAANSMAESFVNQYMTEGNAFNKAIKNYNQASDNLINSADNAMDSAYNNPNQKLSNPDTRAKVMETRKDLTKKFKKVSNVAKSYGFAQSDMEDNIIGGKYKNTGFAGKHTDPRHQNLRDKASQEQYRRDKKRWMEIHGNNGQRPEEYLQANRYLNLQKAMRESFDEMKLGLYEAGDAGLLNPEFIPVMIEAVEFYLES